ncbi:hypothetical protein [Chitinibacter tainanensis]|uniref:hypothetical protein n=1 Tax=Chitinibacter tainanensis TaxID=230667 RepID=UPI0003FC0CE0|nr:hypothetical protein [Chitinibacter tainanensis]
MNESRWSYDEIKTGEPFKRGVVLDEEGCLVAGPMDLDDAIHIVKIHNAQVGRRQATEKEIKIGRLMAEDHIAVDDDAVVSEAHDAVWIQCWMRVPDSVSGVAA